MGASALDKMARPTSVAAGATRVTMENPLSTLNPLRLLSNLHYPSGNRPAISMELKIYVRLRSCVIAITIVVWLTIITVAVASNNTTAQSQVITHSHCSHLLIDLR